MATTRRTTRSSIPNTFSTSKHILDDIQKMLRDAGAKEVTIMYEDQGKNRGTACGVKYMIRVNDRDLQYRMLVHIDRTHVALQTQLREKKKQYAVVPWQQAYQTAWANMRDLIKAQMAIVRTMVLDLEEVFLPFQLDIQGNSTMYEVMKRENFMLPTEQEYPLLEGKGFTIVEDK